ncbi:MAG: hydrogenase expression/formation protein HypE, partial [Candidatus Aegiribacteria sp.]|nr:hydrogenase expression/formation protein HypE [Candidatus Aegiribacteria sp.]
SLKTGVSIVTGDTKVVDKGNGDGIFINTAGIGIIPTGIEIAPSKIRQGDAVVLSGDIGRHGIAIMAIREGIRLESTIRSDLTPLDSMVKDLLREGLDIHCMRDLTRGGLASGLNEIASMTDYSIRIEESLIPVHDEVLGACEILGFDPLYVANEGKFVVILPREKSERAVEILRGHDNGRQAEIIGFVEKPSYADVLMTSSIGSERIVDMMSGEQLPRIC